MLHGLERTDGNAELLPLRRVVDRDVEHAADDADEICAREREPDRCPLRQVVVREQPRLAVDGMYRRARRMTRTAQ